jgi:hypothetical protein
MTGPHTEDGGIRFSDGVVFPIVDEPDEPLTNPDDAACACRAVIGWIAIAVALFCFAAAIAAFVKD